MKIVGIIGSQRKNGNTAVLVQETLKPFKEQGVETEMIYLGDYKFVDCNGCEGCKETNICVKKDGMQKLYPVIKEADAIVIGSPSYFYNVTAIMKAFIDRMYCLFTFDENDRSVWVSTNETSKRKYACVIAVCEQKNEADMGYTAEAMVKSLEALSYRVVSTVKGFHLFEAGEVLENKNILNEAIAAGEKLLKTLNLRDKIKP